MVEITPIPDVYADGIGAIEQIGPNERLTLYTEQTSLDGRTRERVVVARIVAPAGVLRMPARGGCN
ncbi:hypothetical protein CCR97_08100 [Rhodoplanes elegans]|uniref:Uncharacterized protein n=1 Tax=Rhodoplanes elegans TaxID=29408 RepID=A0A327KPX9_9BRAD|nr:hypothetical protein [Rhodoplanes elegans]MBK5958173.1 hypothetical protein [Rhodoplanes elegans]RAI40457.1 hypothetical protein CH338_06345 [Rhodoplanes elegans]